MHIFHQPRKKPREERKKEKKGGKKIILERAVQKGHLGCVN